MGNRHLACWILIALVVLSATAPCRGERIKDIVRIKGVRSNPLRGFGLVVGLSGTGDDAPASRRALANLLRRTTGLVLTPNDLASNNIASVMVTAELPPFARTGSTIDVTVSTIGSATSLQGGTLLMTPLMGADDQVYAVAQGAVSIAGFRVAGQAATVSKNHTTVGRIPSGAKVEKEELARFVEKGAITLQLVNSDFTTAENITKAINKLYPKAARTEDAGCVRVEVPKKLSKSDIPGFIDKIGAQEVKVDSPAMVVINERTGTIVVGENVRISTVAIMHGSLSIITQEKDFISQPLPFSRTGTTERIQRTDITAKEEKRPLHVVPRQASVAELARALNAMGLTPRDMITIFQALRAKGALQAVIKII